MGSPALAVDRAKCAKACISMKTKPRPVPTILQLIPALGAGGTEQGCIDVAGAIVEAGGKAIVISNGGSRVPELQRLGALHINMQVHSKNPFVIWQNTKAIKKIIHQHKVHIVHARSRAPAWSGYKACKETNTPFMTTCHAAYSIRNSKWKRKYNSVMAMGDRVIAISNFIADYLRQNYNIAEEAIRLVARGIAMDRFDPSKISGQRVSTLLKEWRVPDGMHVLLLPGRISRIKGHASLIEAMALLDRADVFAVIVGDEQGRTGYREELEALIVKKQLEGRVRIVPHCNDMPAAYALANCALCPSVEPEGFGRVPVESMAMGTPTIATDIGGAKETIIPEETGWVVPPNDPAALANAIRKTLAMTQEEREEYAVRAREHVLAHFSKEVMLGKTLSVYEELLPPSLS